MPKLRLPAEWEPQAAIFLSWPHPKHAWGEDTAQMDNVYLQLVEAISEQQTVILQVQDLSHQRHVQALLMAKGLSHAPIEWLLAPSNDVWTRDYGPITVWAGHKLCLLDFQFNGWGQKYPYALDNQLCKQLAQLPLFRAHQYRSIDWVLEGGSIECDGQGTLLTSSQCLLNPNRNGPLTQSQSTHILQEQLGITRVLWLPPVQLAGDDTDGHIDTLVRFINPTTLAYVQCEDPQDPHYPSLQAMYQALTQFRTLNGQPYTLVPLPLPQPIYAQGERLPATYANFIISNQYVIVPLYADPLDAVILRRLQTYFPERVVIGINANIVIAQHGSLHCISMQIPAP
jgi:agmatine/peptidylarginine deiminase